MLLSCMHAVAIGQVQVKQRDAWNQHSKFAGLLMAAWFQLLLAELMLQMAAYSAVLLSAFAALQ